MSAVRLTGPEREQERRRVWTLKYQKGMTCPQIVSKTGWSRGQVKHMLSEGRELWGAGESHEATGRTQTQHAGESRADFNALAAAIEDSIDEEDGAFDDLLRVIKRQNENNAKRDPILTHAEITIKSDGPIAVLFPSCLHLGGRYTNHEAFKALFTEAIGIDGLFWAMLGDEIEGYIPSFRDLKAVMDQALSVSQQITGYGLILDRLARYRRLLCSAGSQHAGDWFNRRYGYNPIKNLYTEHNLPYFDGQAYIKLHVGDQVYNLAMSHEFPGYSMYNKLHPHGRAHRFMFPNADAIVMGDKHTFAMAEDTSFVWEADAGNRATPFVWFVQAGTAKSGPDPYTIKRWSQGIMEWPILIFDDKTHTIEGTRHLRTVRAWLKNTHNIDVSWQPLRASWDEHHSQPQHIPDAWKGKAIRDAKRSGEQRG